MTAEDLAGFVRAFGQVPVVIVFNRFNSVDFDLTLTETLTTAADLHLNDTSFVSPGVWLPAEKCIQISPDWTQSTFRPWSWPSLPDIAADSRRCLEEIVTLEADALSATPVLEFLKFEESDISLLTTNALELLDPLATDPGSVTFEGFFLNGCVSLPLDMRGALWDLVGDKQIKQAVGRVIVAELRNWLFTAVLGPGDALVDLPHLTSRMFWLLCGHREEAQVWNSTVTFSTRGQLHEIVDKYHFEKRHWLSRSAVWTRRLGADVQVHELLEGENGERPTKDYVFLEDFSRFVERTEAEAFTSAFDTMWANRFISRRALEDGQIRYAPKVRLN
jgi:hypothetical protein